jgi:SAM-dependent methyltransferase
MEDYEPVMSFDEDVAARYDDVAQRGDEQATVTFLAELAQDGAALELAIGTGRIALPLAARGVRVDGIELAPAMIAQLRAKPGGDQLSVTPGDLADVAVDGRYRLIYVVFNSLFNLLTQDDQVRCFQNVAAHLTDDGSFVIEAFVPSHLHRLRDHQYVIAEGISIDEVRLDVARHDATTQRLEKNHVSLTTGGTRLMPIILRYAWPSELDLMARIAGLRLKERWAGWNREPFTSSSPSHVSVYGR